MKLRFGHVSNSSTSSFIIAGKNTPDFGDIQSIPSFTIYEAPTLHDLDEYFSRVYGNDWMTHHQIRFNNCQERLEQGDSIFFVMFDKGEMELKDRIDALSGQGYVILKREEF